VNLLGKYQPVIYGPPEF